MANKQMGLARAGRRKFIKWASVGAIGAALSSGCRPGAEVLPPRSSEWKQGKSKVVVVTNPAIQAPRVMDPKAMQATVDTAMCRLMGTKSRKDAWAQLVTPQDVVGIKVNVCGGARNNCTHVEFVNAIATGLVEAGVPEEQIIVWDRRDGELIMAGYTISKGRKGMQCYGTPSFDRKSTTSGAVTTRYSTIISKECSVIINAPYLKTSSGVGITIALKNHMGSMDNPWEYHRNGCDPYIADIFAADVVRQKNKLNICDGTYPLFNGGPHENPSYHWAFNGVIASVDPVALDRVGTDILQEHRDREHGGSWPIRPAPRHIATAASDRYKLGTDDPAHIEVDRIEV